MLVLTNQFEQGWCQIMFYFLCGIVPLLIYFNESFKTAIMGHHQPFTSEPEVEGLLAGNERHARCRQPRLCQYILPTS